MTFAGKYKRTAFQLFKMLLLFFAPKLAKIFNFEFIPNDTVNFFIRIIKNQIEERKKSGVKRNDFIDVMTQGFGGSSATETPGDENQFEKDAKLNNVKVDAKKVFANQEDLETAVISNAFLLFFAGFDTSSSSMATCAYFLAKTPDVQRQLYEEVREAIDSSDSGQYLDYHRIQELPFLESCVMEATRLYPLTNLERLCTKPYHIKGTDIVIPKGVLVQIPIVNMMKDPKYWKNPERFDPSRFLDEAECAERGPYAFFTFGHGPRNCVGKRFALLQNKLALFRLIANFELVTCEDTPETLIPDPRSTSFQPKGGMWIKCKRRA